MLLLLDEIPSWIDDDGIQDLILEAIVGHEFKPYRGLGLGDEAVLASRFLKQLAGDKSRLMVSWEGCRPAGLVFLRDLPWDSRLFGKRMSRIEAVIYAQGVRAEHLVRDVVRRCTDEGVDHVSTRVDFADFQTIHALEANGFLLVDTLLTLYSRCRCNAPTDGLVDYNPSHKPSMLDIANRGFVRSRFMTDPHLGRSSARLVYSRWVEEGINGRADFIKVAIDGERASGFVLCRKSAEQFGDHTVSIGTLDLIAVDPSRQGQGIGRRLTEAACAWLGQTCDVYFVGTRCDNFPAIGAYLSAGFRFYSGKVGFHVWLGD